MKSHSCTWVSRRPRASRLSSFEVRSRTFFLLNPHQIGRNTYFFAIPTGFDRSYLKVGASTRVTLSVNKKEISIWLVSPPTLHIFLTTDAHSYDFRDVVSQAWVVPSGTFTVNVGQSSRKILLTGSFEV